MRNVLTAAAFAAIAALLTPLGPAMAQASDAAFRVTTLNLSAEGEVRAKPDIATLTLGVTSEAQTAQAASAEVTRRANAVAQALRNAGVAQADIQTRWVELSPRYSDRPNAPSEVVAQQASTTMTVTVRRLDHAGALLDAGVAAGANVVQGISFGLADPTAPQREARDQALRALQEDAAHAAGVLNQRVVRLVSVNTQAYAGPAPAAQLRMAVAAAPGLQVEPGELTVRASANGVFELAPRAP
jgi:hypothetical protein